jgi:hypothetical protein
MMCTSYAEHLIDTMHRIQCIIPQVNENVCHLTQNYKALPSLLFVFAKRKYLFIPRGIKTTFVNFTC